jgi:hypothetical protein
LTMKISARFLIEMLTLNLSPILIGTDGKPADMVMGAGGVRIFM